MFCDLYLISTIHEKPKCIHASAPNIFIQPIGTLSAVSRARNHELTQKLSFLTLP